MDRIMNETLFVGDQRQIVLDAIRRVDNTYEPNYIAPSLLYNNNKLVEPLNKNILPIGESLNQSESDAKPALHSSKYRPEDIQAMMKSQLDTEINGRIIVKSITKTSPENQEAIALSRQKLNTLLNDWRSCITKNLKRDLNTLQHTAYKRGFHSVNVYPYLRILNIDRLVDIIMEEIKYLTQNSMSYSPNTSQLYAGIGRVVMAQYQMETKKRNGIVDKITEIYPKYCDLLLNSNTPDNPRQIWQRLEYEALKSGPSLNISDPIWPYSVQCAIGKFLYQMLYLLKIDVGINKTDPKDKKYMLPVFYTLLRHRDEKMVEEVKVHSVYLNLYRSCESDTLTFDSNLIPMSCPPLPWTSSKNGAYLVRSSDLIRLPFQAVQQMDYIESAPASNIYPALDSLNQLAAVPWKVNGRVLDVIIDVFNSGGNEKIDVPPPPSALNEEEFVQPMKGNDEQPSESMQKAQKYRESMAIQQKKGEMYSLWCDALYRLSMANHFRDKMFWLPQNMDFRGRVYPIPPHLNHIGSDLSRCLFLFHEARPLGKDGLRWLKLHCINLTGMKKKSSLDERLQFAEEVMDDIIDSAENPLNGRQWWAQSDEPWQTLACCMEIANVIRSPNPEAYMCHFPVHQDGSCNGLQHYAALGRDQIGAVSVNLANSPRPQDVYVEVANKVEEKRKQDAANGVDIAAILEGFVTRKVIKQTVMTTVYGVTYYGARLQIGRQLKYIDEFPQDRVAHAATYLTQNTFNSLRAMFTSAKEIQDWLTSCARQISGVRKQNVEWVTPLGLPIVQPYVRSTSRNKFVANIGSSSTDSFEIPNVNKQKNAFPPNFIHSLDSSHMMLTSLNCAQTGINFASVHDCFWTHPETVAEMNKICRDQFVLLHSQPILEDLSRFFVEKFNFSSEEFTGNSTDQRKTTLNHTLNAYPKKGKFILKSVLDSAYFFS